MKKERNEYTVIATVDGRTRIFYIKLYSIVTQVVHDHLLKTIEALEFTVKTIFPATLPIISYLTFREKFFGDSYSINHLTYKAFFLGGGESLPVEMN